MTITLIGSGSIVYCYFEEIPQHGDIVLLRDWLQSQHGTVMLCGEHAAAVYAELFADKPNRCHLNYCNNVDIPNHKDWQLTLHGASYETC